MYREADILNYLDTEKRLIQAKIDAENWKKAYAEAKLLNLHKLPPFFEPHEVDLGHYPDWGLNYTRLSRRGPWLRLAENGFWYLKWSENKKQKSRNTKTKDRDEAEAILKKFIKDRAGD